MQPSTLLEAIQLYSLSLFFLFYLLNYGKLLSKPRAWCAKSLPAFVRYPFSCAFCFSWWIGLMSMVLGAGNALHVVAAPVLVMFLNLAYLKLQPYNVAVNNTANSQPPTLPKS